LEKGDIMKKILAIVFLLLTSANIANGATWLEWLQETLTGNPEAVATKTEEVSAPSETPGQSQSSLDQIKKDVPSLMGNIKLVVAKLNDVKTKVTEGGFFSGLKAAFSINTETANAFSQLTTQAGAIVLAARNLLNTSDSQTKATVQGLIAEVVKIPEFQQLVEYAKTMPFIGKQLSAYLDSLKQEAEVK
jgi:hypothetical protein